MKFLSYDEFLNEQDSGLPGWGEKYKDPYYGFDNGKGPKPYVNHAGDELQNKLIDKSSINVAEIEGLSDEDRQKISDFDRQCAELRKDHKRSGYTEPFILMAKWVLYTGLEMPKHQFTLAQGATWGMDFLSKLNSQKVISIYKKGRQLWLKSELNPHAQEILKKYLEERDVKFQHDSRGVITAQNIGVI